MRLTCVCLFLLLMGGCATSRMDVATLQSEGYTKIVMKHTEDQSENVNYALWVKEVPGVSRKVEICLVPSISVAEYYWTVAVLVDDKATWHHSNTVSKGFGGRSPIECVTSGALPPGRLTYSTSFRYKALEGIAPAVAPQPTTAPPKAPVTAQPPPAAQRPADTTPPSSKVSPPAVETSVAGLTSAQAPTWLVGYEWKYRWSSPRGSGTYFRTFVRKEVVDALSITC